MTPEREAIQLARGIPPDWADSWGKDDHGAFAGFRVGEVEQRMRWIPAGSFVMGSPEDEAERDNDEGPQHLVTLTSGFWLADTPCTQAMWEAVMGENPSRFKGPQRPVESISWDDVQGFLLRLTTAQGGLAACLPTEAQWEHACRVTSAQPRYGALDDIAWHLGNSGQETRDVAGKAANRWGLYDMLGNVWEWCADAWRQNYAAEPDTDPLETVGPGRVQRGGSFWDNARYLRAACRVACGPGYRYRSVGFRLARGQALRQ